MAKIHGLAPVATVVALALPASACADAGLILRRAIVQQGDVMTVWGGCREPIYLVSEAYAKRTFLYYFALSARGPPTRPPYQPLGRTTCTGRLHYIGDFPDGDWSSWSGYLRFRVPRVRPGRYVLVAYRCLPWSCGKRGSLSASNWLWRGSKRIGPSSLRIVRRR
jgi:hypothetical protein